MSVLPELQRRGVGKQLMAWGLERADQLGLETFIEALEAGHKLYEGCGYMTICQVEVTLEESTAGKDDEWMELQRTKLLIRFSAVWRPKHGTYEKGDPERTWNEHLKLCSSS
jgi:hypothetical protein